MENSLFKAILTSIIGGVILLFLQYKYFEPTVPKSSSSQPSVASVPKQEPQPILVTPQPIKPDVLKDVLKIDSTTKFQDIGYQELTIPRRIKEIIIIDTQTRRIETEIKQLKKYGVAYHYLISPYGEIKLLVEESNVAFHTFARNEYSIGIGLIHVSGQTYPELQINALVSLLTDIVNRYNIYLSMILAGSQTDPKKKYDLLGILDEIRKRVNLK